MARRKSRTRRAENAVPVAFMGLGLTLIAVLLPSALRPPAPQTPQTAQLSPDAPPDNKTESLIASLNRASSGTAGAGAGTPTDLGAAGDGLLSLPPPPSTVGCPHGYGNPPRQTESPYSAPCAAKFNGNNGGTTYKNVSASEIKVGFWHVLGMPAQRGAVPKDCGNLEPVLRTYCWLQAYWNSRYEFYGRYLQLDAAKDDPADDPSAGQAADNQYALGDFAVVHLSDAFCHEFTFVKHQVCFDGTSTHVSVQNDAAPYWWTLQMNHEENEYMYGEYACKKLIGRTPDYAGAGGTNFDKSKPRKLGVIMNNASVTGRRTASAVAAQIKQQCGYQVDPAAIVDARDDDSSQSQTTAVLKMENAHVSTILMWGDTAVWDAVMAGADGNAYYPEWVGLNSNGLDFNTSAKAEPPLQMAHFFGMSGWEMPRPFADSDCYKAYKAMDPANTPDQTACALLYPSLEHVLNGIQLAGPHLTPTTFQAGMYKYGHPKPLNNWEIGGGFGPDGYGAWHGADRSWVDTYAEMWWDATAIDPQTGNPGGAYRYTDGGRRYGPGEIPTTLHVFGKSDVTGVQ